MLHFFSDANQKLHDTNDDLRAALENLKTKKPASAVSILQHPCNENVSKMLGIN